MTINQAIRQRRAVYRELNRRLRIVDALVEKAQRHVKNQLARRKTVIEVKNLNQYAQIMGTLLTSVNAAIEEAYKNETLFS